jgi:membrane protease YdiL (CAAX protease family)
MGRDAHFFAIVRAIGDASIALNAGYQEEIGRFLGQIFGNALHEEAMFRGVLFLQLHLVFKERVSFGKSVVTAAAASSLVFAVLHIPNRLLAHQVENILVDQVVLFAFGLFFCVFVWWKENLVYAVIFHAFVNYALFLFDAEDLPLKLVFLAIFLVLVAAQKGDGQRLFARAPTASY